MSKFTDIQIDPAIVKRAARGDAKAHEIIYRAFSAPVYSVCLRFTRVPAQAEDLLQETFIEVIRSIRGFRGDAPVGAWIRRIAVSKALMFLRSAWHARGQTLDDDWEEMTFEHRPGVRAFRAARPGDGSRRGARPSCRRSVARWSGCTMSRDTRTRRSRLMLGKTESFSKSQLSRAYQRCGRCWAPSSSGGKRARPWPVRRFRAC